MKLLKNLCFILTTITITATAQDYKLGKVTVAELEEKQHPKDSSAEAAILFEKGRTHCEYSQNEGFQMYTDVDVKIKIYKKEGYEWANKSVIYFTGGQNNETIMFSKAVTYNLVNGQIEKTKLKSEGEFIEKYNRYNSIKKIAMPNVKEGSIIEYSYTRKSPVGLNLPKWYFQTSIPVNYSEFITSIPEYFTYTATQKGYIQLKTTVDNISKTITFYKHNVADNINYSDTKTTYIAENVPAMKDEDFVNNINNYTSSISNELVMTKVPESYTKMYSSDWESVVKKIYEDDDFGSELNKVGYFEDDVTTVIKGLSTNEEKIDAIYNFVKNKVKWNDYNGYSCIDGVKKAYKDGVGNAAEINLMLTSMLRYAGITANPVIISTRKNGVSYFPSITAFNYVIAAVEVADGLLLMDATEKYGVPNILPTRDLNWFGRLIRKDGTSTEVDLMPKTISREFSNIIYELKKDGSIEGNIKTQYTNNLALNFRNKNLKTNKESYIENLEHKYNNIEIIEYNRENDTELSNPISETISFKSSNSSEIIGDKIYIAPLIFLATKENPFKQETREYPVDFGYPIETKYIINIKIPEGYVVETLPQSISLSAGEEIGGLKYIAAQNEDSIQIIITETISAAIIAPDYYEVLKSFFQQMIDKENEKIVLKKI